MNVIQAIIALLYDHDTVIVPALGAFVRHDEGAQVNVITNEFQKPTSTLSFDPEQREENPLIIEYLMLHEGLSDEEARQQIATFVAECYAKMREGETVTLEGLGTLAFNSLQEPVFEPEASTDFNADAFGLDDLEVQPVFSATPTPTTPAPTSPGERPAELARGGLGPQEKPRRKTWWIWLLLVLVAAAVALWYFMFRPIKPEPPVQKPLDSITMTDTVKPITDDTLAVPTDSLAIENDTVSHNEPVNETVSPTEVVKPAAESKAFIVGGCFSVEQNALNMAMEAYEQGCKEAFVMKRGTKFFVCYGQYPSATEAKVALPVILEKYNQKAWILVK